MKTPDEIKKALEMCAYEQRCDNCPYGGVDCADLETDALEYIKQLEAAQMKWISVEERLPDEPCEVLACWYGRICIACYSNRCFEIPSGMVLYVAENAVTHWMPLPEPPKEEAHD